MQSKNWGPDDLDLSMATTHMFYVCEDMLIKHLLKLLKNLGIEIEDALAVFELTREGDNEFTSALDIAYRENY